MKEIIISVLAQVMKRDAGEFQDDTVICDIPGFDSLQFVMTISELQETYNIEIPLNKAIEARTIGELIECAKTMP